ncbi:MAG: heme exporter protein CcmD [Porticoccus sp.]|nr:heme exporter protein CcmD [Porticoccus sp.]PCJ93007.1 MAG: heme exporter protein CcmD [Porticoccaceae bacterium]
MFRFENINDFIQMGGHGYYVWSAYLISLIALAWLVISPLVRRKQFMKEIARQQQRERARQQSTDTNSTSS